MVYYPSTPLIVKTEQSSQAQYCSPLQLAPATSTTPELNIQTYHNLSNSNGLATSLLTSVSQMSNGSNSSIIGQYNSNNSQYLTNIKTELLPQGISLYAANTNNANLNNLIKANSANVNSLSGAQHLEPNAVASTTSSTTAAPASTRRKANNGNKPQFKCEQCGMTFNSKSAHTSHTKSHAKNGEYGFASSQLANQASNAIEVNEAGVPLGIPKTPLIKPNASAVPGGDPYECNVCHKTFAVPARLIRHYRTHTGERPFECEFCHKLFSVKENLQVHRRIHTKERPYKCDVCGRAFEHSGKLHRHMRIHTGERPHKCSVCDKTFIQSGQLVIHMRTHTGEKPYKCPVEGCGKGFTCSKQLKVHSRTHTGEKPYHCDICFRDFGYNHVLKLHRVQHYGSKCYKCTICDETFKNKKEMEAHIKGHANEMPDEEEDSNAEAVEKNNSAAENNGSAPSSPQSPISSSSAKPRKERKPRSQLTTATTTTTVAPGSPSSPSSTMSPISSSMGSASRLSMASPTFSVASPLSHETDQHSRDSGMASSKTLQHAGYGSAMAQQQQQQLAQTSQNYGESFEEMPTDLSASTAAAANGYQQPGIVLQEVTQFVQQPHGLTYGTAELQHNELPKYAAMQLSVSPQHMQQHATMPQPHSPPMINQVLLEAAAIRQRDIMDQGQQYLTAPAAAVAVTREEEVTQAALQIMQLRRSQNTLPHMAAAPGYHLAPLVSDNAHYEDSHEVNELIEHYKRGDLVRHGMHKGYAPVPKFESSFLNNEIIVRQVEAAIAPLRSSTESPERSSSPESDTMLMADRDVMTLPLRKRKLYMSDEAAVAEAEEGAHLKDAAVGSKVMRMSSVIQFAKAS